MDARLTARTAEPARGRLDARRLYACAVSGGVPQRAFLVALVVGTVLNLINQGDALATGGPISWLKLGLTYVVPYAVCTYGAVTAKLRSGRLP